MNIERLKALLERMEAGDDTTYDDFGMAIGDLATIETAYYGYLGDVRSAVKFCKMALPGWWWNIGTCHLSDDARVCPDFNCPTHGERLRETLDESTDWASLTDVDLRPSGNPARALVMATVKGLIAKGEG